MRHYSLLLPPFWTGPTGKAITAAGKDARIIATYVLTSQYANMIGLYRLPLLYAIEETGLKRRGILAALEHLRVLDFAAYDEPSEFIWVFEMGRIQLGLLPGEVLKEGDKRAKGATSLYKNIPSNPFLGSFYEHYAPILRLPAKRDFLSEQKPHRSPLGGAVEPLIRGPYSDHDPDPASNSVRKGDMGGTNRRAPLSRDFVISDNLWDWTVQKGYSRELVEREFEKFCNRNKAKGEKYADWDAAFRNWLIKGQEFASERNGRAQPGPRRPIQVVL